MKNYNKTEEESKNQIFIRNEKTLIGMPFKIDYDTINIFVSDKWKQQVNGVPKGTFLLAKSDIPEEQNIAFLLRVIKPIGLPNDLEVISALLQYKKENLSTSPNSESVDPQTKSEFGYSGLMCHILGTFYLKNNELMFGSDIENFYGANNYTVYKPLGEELKQIVNQGLINNKNNNKYMSIGTVKYSSTTFFDNEPVDVLVNSEDFVGKRTAIFGTTRSGKSNTAKILVEWTNKMSSDENPVGQLIFDINGEYANKNQQDKISIYDLLKEDVERYSIIKKEGFKPLMTNFYNNVAEGFNILKSFISDSKVDYVNNFLSIELNEPNEDDYENNEYMSAITRYNRVKAAYLCCLHEAGFECPNEHAKNIYFNGNNKILDSLDIPFDPSEGITITQAKTYFKKLWDNYENLDVIINYPKNNDGREWADEDLKAVLTMLTGSKHNNNGTKLGVSGYKKLRKFSRYHTSYENDYKNEILEFLRSGKIVIIDLSQGDNDIRDLYSKELCEYIFLNAMDNFTNNKNNNPIQLYFEEAHNLFPKGDKDLKSIYNRIAKEGAKLNLGLIYATQEVSSISSNIIKNTQNFFISHLNNTEELNELRKFTDFEDFIDSLIRFSPEDKGFVRMKTYSNPFVIPAQINLFGAEEE